ncbi:uncharacterized protein SEPMUDRAFT_117691 [Sphaerulina musiva SO2202]|uniref:Uncharacterized protein n=1 Tax=Sphaerulina musiva (strain SO2202) TaxID=692275 RepID=N1QEZ5_SPHMS|nr:uncharacterized protein SEPMUDRAFT_117691 [Sphaerulina musiva SO2202]EMF11717.1 hypothetical protein SEPMUDRAFT_117691 [Sphaerulina musiva SO2202]
MAHVQEERFRFQNPECDDEPRHVFLGMDPMDHPSQFSESHTPPPVAPGELVSSQATLATRQVRQTSATKGVAGHVCRCSFHADAPHKGRSDVAHSPRWIPAGGIVGSGPHRECVRVFWRPAKVLLDPSSCASAPVLQECKICADAI